MEPAHHVELVRHRTHPALRGVVAGVVGMSEVAAGAVCRRQPAGGLMPLVLSFGEALEIEGAAHGSFVAGLSTSHTSTGSSGGRTACRCI